VLVFNLLPAFPLDGGRVLRSILWGATGDLRRATRWAALAGQVFAGLLFAWAVLQLFAGHLLGGVWTGLVGMFLNNAARSSYQEVLVRQALRGEPVRRFMTRDPVAVPPSLDLRHWVEDYVYRYHHRAFPVTSDGHPEGLVTTRALGRFPQEEWAAHTVREAMTPDLGAVSVPADADALEALGKMQRGEVSRLLVTDAGRLVGIVTLKDLLRFLDLKLELEGRNGHGPGANGPPSEARESETTWRS
jgi:CBS domain-containing protein